MLKIEVGGSIELQLLIVQRPHICCNPPKATEKTSEQSPCTPTNLFIFFLLEQIRTLIYEKSI